MSYDLMVFDPKAAPLDRRRFLEWYDEQTLWVEDHGYHDDGVTTADLRAWFLEMLQTFPAMNGPHAAPDTDDARVTEYTIGRSVVYAAFAQSVSRDARRTALELARKHRVGFFDVSAEDGEICVPDAKGGALREREPAP